MELLSIFLFFFISSFNSIQSDAYFYEYFNGWFYLSLYLAQAYLGYKIWLKKAVDLKSENPNRAFAESQNSKVMYTIICFDDQIKYF